MLKHYLLLLIFIAGAVSAEINAPAVQGEIKPHNLESEALADNLIGLNTRRQIRVYLPPGYQQNNRRYPALYYIPQGEQLLEDGQFVTLLITWRLPVACFLL